MTSQQTWRSNKPGIPRSLAKLLQFQTENTKLKFQPLLKEFKIYRDFPKDPNQLKRTLGYILLQTQLASRAIHPRLLALLEDSGCDKLKVHLEELLKFNEASGLWRSKLAQYYLQNIELDELMLKLLTSISDNQKTLAADFSDKFSLKLALHEPSLAKVTPLGSGKESAALLYWKGSYAILYSQTSFWDGLSAKLQNVPLKAFNICKQLQVLKTLKQGRPEDLFKSDPSSSKDISRQEGSIVMSKFSNLNRKEQPLQKVIEPVESLTSSKNTDKIVDSTIPSQTLDTLEERRKDESSRQNFKRSLAEQRAVPTRRRGASYQKDDRISEKLNCDVEIMQKEEQKKTQKVQPGRRIVQGRISNGSLKQNYYSPPKPVSLVTQYVPRNRLPSIESKKESYQVQTQNWSRCMICTKEFQSSSRATVICLKQIGNQLQTAHSNRQTRSPTRLYGQRESPWKNSSPYKTQEFRRPVPPFYVEQRYQRGPFPPSPQYYSYRAQQRYQPGSFERSHFQGLRPKLNSVNKYRMPIERNQAIRSAQRMRVRDIMSYK